MRKLADAAIVILLGLFILLTSFSLVFNLTPFYKHEFEKTGTYTRIADADTISDNLRSYLNWGNNLNESYYTQREILHLRDVKTLIICHYLALLLSAVALFALLTTRIRQEKRKARYLSHIFLLAPSILLLSILILSLFDFSSLFTLFHRLLFTNNFWLLPAESTLIRLYPESFFQDFTRMTGCIAATVCVILYALGGFLSTKRY